MSRSYRSKCFRLQGGYETKRKGSWILRGYGIKRKGSWILRGYGTKRKGCRLPRGYEPIPRSFKEQFKIFSEHSDDGEWLDDFYATMKPSDRASFFVGLIKFVIPKAK